MIGQLRGSLLAKQPPLVLLDVNGVGYEVELALSAFAQLPALGEPITLITHFAVRDDAQLLYGFLHERDRLLFRALLKVTGVGARLALEILGAMDAGRFAQCVALDDVTALMRIPGIGKKTAQRLIMELRDRLGGLTDGAPSVIAAPAVNARELALNDAVSALMALGYRPPEATRMARAADDGTNTTEDIIRTALRQIPNA
ncbi:Holliday junction branch migration protein RuvA [Chromatium weissei]|nr:Holliday junction branch migration protein RuvA [Chromatium weissei]